MLKSLTQKDAALLALLRYGPMHAPSLEWRTNGAAWAGTASTLRTLGLVERRTTRGNDPMRLTAEGRVLAQEVRARLRAETIKGIVECSR